MSFEKREDCDEDKSRKVRSNYFQTEFSITFGKRKDEKNCSSSSSSGMPDEPLGRNQERKKNISVQADRNVVGQEEIPKERKKWIRPPLVGQASTSTDVVIPAHQELETDSDEDIIETSHPIVEPTTFASRPDYRNRKDYINEKPPEGGVIEQEISPVTNQGEYIKSASPTSSVTSSRPLEWDSGADVGYFQFYSGQSKEAELSTLERLALQRGSASLLTRSDPEGTTGSSVVNPNVALGRPKAESTPVSTLSNKSKDTAPDKEVYYPLFPEVIIQEHEQISDSDFDANKPIEEFPFKKSSSLEAVAKVKPSSRSATFPRSQSQSNMVFNINTHLQKMLANTKSNSSSSVATVVTGKKKVAQNALELEASAGDRANSFEYLPGHIYENKSNELSFTEGQDLKKDVERGVQLLSDFVKGSNANNTLLRKKLLHNVVEALISADYLSDNDWSPELKRCVTRRSQNRDISGESSTGEENSRSRKTDKECSTVPSSMASHSMPNSAQNSSESKTSDSLSISNKKLQMQKIPKSNINKIKEKSVTSSDISKSSSNWKEPVTKSEKILEARKMKGYNAPLDAKLIQYLCSERENQIDWIKKEITHLSNLKQLLEKHEFLRRNFASLKNKKQRTISADALKSGRHLRKKSEYIKKAHSEPGNVENNHPNNYQKWNRENLESDYNSHNYDTDRGDGVKRRHVSTDTREWTTKDGWQQVPEKKKSFAYTILFEPENGKENINCENQNRDRILENGPVVDRDTLMKISRHKIKEQFSKMSLKDELFTKRPEYIARAEGRRQIVAELTALRELRQKHKTNVLAAAVCQTEQPIPPPPLALKRVVSQRAMRTLTEKKYKQTFEVQKRQQDLRRKEDYNTNRLLADVFKKKLQKRTLNGQTDFSNSINIISSSV